MAQLRWLTNPTAHTTTWLTQGLLLEELIMELMNPHFLKTLAIVTIHRSGRRCLKRLMESQTGTRVSCKVSWKLILTYLLAWCTRPCLITSVCWLRGALDSWKWLENTRMNWWRPKDFHKAITAIKTSTSLSRRIERMLQAKIGTFSTRSSKLWMPSLNATKLLSWATEVEMPGMLRWVKASALRRAAKMLNTLTKKGACLSVKPRRILSADL